MVALKVTETVEAADLLSSLIERNMHVRSV